MGGPPCPKGKDLMQVLPWEKSCQSCSHWRGHPDTGWCACDLQDTDNLVTLGVQQAKEAETDV